MSIKRNRFGIPATASAMLAATMLLSSTAYGQDVSKSIQVEAPLVNLLKGNLDVGESGNDSVLRLLKEASSQRQPIPVQPSLGKRDIESSVELLLVDSGNLSGSSDSPSNRSNLPNSDASKANPTEQDKGNLLIANIGKDAAKLPADNRARSKAFIELPTKQLIDLGRAAENDRSEFEDTLFASSRAKSENPSVEPGLVDWHADLKTAASQSKISGKPVFHFQLLGQLDQRFT